MQILGLAGSAGTYFCMFCLGTLNETLKAGIPHLRTLPEPWASTDVRELHIISPPMRPDTMEMERQAELYAAAAAEKPGISSAPFFNCIEKPLVHGTNMLQLLAGVPLHCSLGAGLIFVNNIEELVKEIDAQVLHETAENSNDPSTQKAVADKFESELAVGDAEEALRVATDAVADAEGRVEGVCKGHGAWRREAQGKGKARA